MTTDLSAAVPADGVDAGIALHYGDPLREQRILATKAGVVDRSNRDVLRVGGAERLSWLHTIISQHVENLADGESTESLVLSPRGHVEQHWQLTELGEAVWIDTEPGAGAAVLGYLESMRFLKRVEPADVTADWALLSLVGPSTPEVLAAADLPVSALHMAAPIDGGGFVRRMAWPSSDAADLLVPRSVLPSVRDRLVDAGAEPAGVWAFEALRVEARRPRLGFETDHRTIPHEVGWIGSAVHLQKGCYRGQETVARVQNLGAPPRRLVLLHLSGMTDDLPASGTSVEADGRPVGFLGTALHHHEFGPIALAVVKRVLPPDTLLSVAGSPVSVDPD